MSKLNISEDEVMAIVNRVANSLAHKFKFGFNELEDMKQYARMFAIQGIKKYNEKRGTLETFLWIYVHNRLFNLKRDNFERPDKPCLHCPLNAYDPHNLKSGSQCTAYNDKMCCDLYNKWYMRNSKKRNVISPIELGNVDDEKENNMKIYQDVGEKIDYNNIMKLIDEQIPIPFRSLWLKFQNDAKLNKSDRDKLFAILREILKSNGIDETCLENAVN